jgi:ABC-type sugar transport system ATPase subunit
MHAPESEATTTSVKRLVARGVTKRYEQTLALDDVSLALTPGEVHAVVGHNGAGKSTLLRVLAGAERPDGGSLHDGEQPLEFSAPADALALGISTVYQELSLVDDLTVAENVFLGREITSRGRIEKTMMRRATQNLLEEFDVEASAGEKARNLPVAVRQLIEIVAALGRDTRFLLLDEPTTALEHRQVDRVLEIIRRLARERGLAVLLIDHKLDEVFAVADRVTALANGRVVLSGTTAAVNREDVVQAIVGEPVYVEGLHPTPRRDAPASRPVLRVDHLRSERLGGITLTAREGQILGIYGLVGSGRTRFLRTLLGLEPLQDGVLELGGEPYFPTGPGAAIARGVAYLSEERKADGFIPLLTPLENVALPVMRRFERFGVLRRRPLRAAAGKALAEVDVRGRIDGKMTDLSGGNQQKVLFGRALLQRPRLLLLDEPTKGVDIGAKAEIHELVRRFAAKGDAVIVVSSEEEELLGMSNEITVFVHGHCDGTAYPSGSIDASRLKRLAWGESRESN